MEIKSLKKNNLLTWLLLLLLLAMSCLLLMTKSSYSLSSSSKELPSRPTPSEFWENDAMTGAPSCVHVYGVQISSEIRFIFFFSFYEKWFLKNLVQRQFLVDHSVSNAYNSLILPLKLQNRIPAIPMPIVIPLPLSIRLSVRMGPPICDCRSLLPVIRLILSYTSEILLSPENDNYSFYQYFLNGKWL